MTVTEGIVSCTISAIFYVIARVTRGEAQRLKTTPKLVSFEELGQKVSETSPPVFVLTGTVGCPNPVECSSGVGSGAVLRREVERFYIRRPDVLSEWTRGSESVSATTSERPWFLEDGSGNVVWVVGAKDLAPLTKVSEVMEASLKSFLDSNLAALTTATGVKNIGHQVTEHVLPLGTQLTVVGELARAQDILIAGGNIPPASTTTTTSTTRSSGSLSSLEEGGEGSSGSSETAGRSSWVVSRPTRGGGRFHVTDKTPEELLSSLGDIASFCRAVSIGCAVLGGSCLVYAAVRSLMKRVRHRRLKRQAQRHAARNALNQPPPPESGDQDGTKEEKLCSICWSQPFNAVFKECGHLCCCIDCAMKVNKCPICRRKSQAIRVYTP